MILYRNTPGYIDASMVVIATGAPFTAGTVHAYVRRKSDNKWLWQSDTWDAAAPTGANIPTLVHAVNGGWDRQHTPADQDDTYSVSCIDSGGTCYPDNYTVPVRKLYAAEASVLARPTLAEIEGSKLAKEATLLAHIRSGVLSSQTTITGDAVTIVQGTKHKLLFTLGEEWDLTAKKAYFCMKTRENVEADAADSTALVSRECAITGVRTCEIDLTDAETAAAGLYLAELEIRNDPAGDEPQKPVQFPVRITPRVRKGA